MKFVICQNVLILYNQNNEVVNGNDLPEVNSKKVEVKLGFC